MEHQTLPQNSPQMAVRPYTGSTKDDCVEVFRLDAADPTAQAKQAPVRAPIVAVPTSHPMHAVDPAALA
jgi:hypothetical protein